MSGGIKRKYHDNSGIKKAVKLDKMAIADKCKRLEGGTMEKFPSPAHCAWIVVVKNRNNEMIGRFTTKCEEYRFSHYDRRKVQQIEYEYLKNNRKLIS